MSARTRLLQRAAMLGILTVACTTTKHQSQSPMHYGNWGIDTSSINTAIRPGDDFFRYANDRWLARTPIPVDKPKVSLRTQMTDLTQARIREILEASADGVDHDPGDTNRKIGAFYKSFMDESRIELLREKPLDPLLAAIRSTRSHEELGTMMGRANFNFVNSFFEIAIEIDQRDPTSYAVKLKQSGLGLPSREYYLEGDAATKEIRRQYQAYVEYMLGAIRWADPPAEADRIVQLESSIAAASWSAADRREVDKTYNPMTVAMLENFAPDFPWRSFLNEAGLAKVDRVIVAERTAFPKIAAIFARTPISTVKAWLAFQATSSAAKYLSQDFNGPRFQLYGHALNGQQEEEPRWKRGVRQVAGDLESGPVFGDMAWAVGRIYAERYFPPTSKARVEAIIADLRGALRRRIEQLDWMTTNTKAAAIEKLDAYIVKVGYPDEWRDYSDLTIRDDDLVGNVRRAAEAQWAHEMQRLQRRVDRNEWVWFTPQTNNASNDGDRRHIDIPAAVLQPPMFDPQADAAVNYGAIGAYIGHEWTHGFDDQGRKLDSQGRLRNWWSKADDEAFRTRSTELRRQYEQFVPLPGIHVNGQLTLGENIADLGGVLLAIDAYHAALGGVPPPTLDGFTGDQRVFLGWAQAWRGKVSEEFLRNQVKTDPHSPRQYRVNGVLRNIDSWYEAFNIQPGDKLFVSPEERVRLW